jgi:hypothetical protein
MATKRVLEYIARPTWTVVTLILLTFAVFFAQFLVVGLVWLYTYEKKPHPKPPDGLEWKTHNASKLFLPDTTLHFVHRMDTQSDDDYTKEEITDVNGNVLWQGIRKERPFKYLDWGKPPREYTEFFSERQMRRMFMWIPWLSRVLEAPVRVGGEVKEVWQYDFEAQAFAGYEVGGGPMGYLGADGFAAFKAQPFGEFKGFTSWTDDDPSSVVMLWWTKRQIYQIDFRSRKVETVFDGNQSDIELIRWHQWRPMNPKDGDDSGIQYRPLIDCQTADRRHHLILREPNQIITVELPEQMREPNRIFMRRWSNWDFTATDKTIFAQYRERNFNPPKSYKLFEQYNLEYDSKPQPQSIELYKLTSDSKLELLSRFDWTRPVAKTTYVDQEEIFLRWASKTSPPAFDLLMILFGDDLYELIYKGMGMTQGYAAIITNLRPRYSSLNYVLSTAMLAFALWHGWSRRTSLGKLILWLIIVGAFNLAGLLTYLALNHTPVIKCPICGRKRGLERPNCIRCGSPLSVPQRRPTDLIFANPSTSSVLGTPNGGW